MVGLEPPVQAFADEHRLHMTTHDMVGVSIAISLKRIADVLTAGPGTTAFMNFEQLAYRMGQSFEAGRRTG
jgi:hypothetical protein